VKVGLLTREYPPEVYGGAGVHVEYLARELARLEDVVVHAWGAPRPSDWSPPVVSHSAWDALAGDRPELASLRAFSIDLAMAASAHDCDVVHSHTWYANLAGHLAALTYDVPHVVSTHSLEPQRPWKAEQLGGGYALSTWAERTALEAADAVIAVSKGMARDVVAAYPAIDPARVEVIYNGIDSEEYRPDPGTDVLEARGVDPSRPSIVFVGRITRQKGVPHLVRAAQWFDPSVQLVLCAGQPDTPEIGAEVSAGVDRLRETRDGVLWIEEMVPKREVIQLLSHATAFACPSIYEPLGIVNLEAMACEAAVVASAVGGIVEVVEDGVTGTLVEVPDPDATGEPADPEGFARSFADAVNALVADPARTSAMGRAGRARAVEKFAWPSIAEQTVALYRRLVAGS
jgi:starch synthase